MLIGFSQMRIDQTEAQTDKYCFPLLAVSAQLFGQNRLLQCFLAVNWLYLVELNQHWSSKSILMLIFGVKNNLIMVYWLIFILCTLTQIFGYGSLKVIKTFAH